MKNLANYLRACLKITRGPAERDFGVCQGGGVRASLQRAVRTEPTTADDKRPDALRVFAGKAGWLRCSSVEDPPGIFSFVAPCHPTFPTKTGPLGILRLALIALAVVCFGGRAAGAASEDFVPWQNTRLIGTPEPPPPFRAVRAYPRIKSHDGKTPEHEPYGPVAVKREPGASRIIFLENYGYSELRGVMRRFTAVANAAETETLLELKEHVYSLTFHPDFARNGFVFLGINGPNDAGKKHTRIVRYTFDRKAPFRILPDSRRVIIEWPSNGHNGGDCAFGNDGMLYVTSGDGTSGLDGFNSGQDLTSMLGKVMRVDVDRAPADRTYLVPSDNPFLKEAGARPEIWAYGLRNPWRITSDRESGQIWVGENGQDLREYAHLLGRAENYGWSAYEGSRAFLTNRLKGPSPFTPPTVEHDHSLFRSLTGGVVYRGRNFPELAGAYVYGDFSTGRIWAIRHDGQRVLWQRELTDTPLTITGFGEDVDGEPLVADYGGGFHRLARAEPRSDAPAFPRLLSETGIFSDTAAQLPAPGVVAYDINAPGWHDGARSRHWLALPKGVKLKPETDATWTADDGVALVQTLSLETSDGPRRLETRILLKQENDWSAYTFIWNAAQTDAELAPAAGRRIALSLPSGNRDWLVPARGECLVCHSRAANYALTLTTRQLNRSFAGADGGQQLRWLEQHGLLRADDGASRLPKPPEDLPRFPRISDTRLPAEERARTYLAVNCAHCHVSDGGGNSAMNMAVGLKLKDARLIDEPPQHGTFGAKDARIIAPAKPGRSVLVTRMALRIPGQMPPLGTLRSDLDGVRLLTEWISSLPAAPVSIAPKPTSQ